MSSSSVTPIMSSSMDTMPLHRHQRQTLILSKSKGPAAASSTTRRPTAADNVPTAILLPPSGIIHNNVVPKKPMRPLTAYHIFFQIEREYVIQSTAGPDADSTIHDNKIYHPNVPRRYRDVRLSIDWYAGPGKRKKRKHRKGHGKIGFLELSKVISERWARLDIVDPETKSFVKKIAQSEIEEYYREVKEYKEMLAANGLVEPTATTTEQKASNKPSQQRRPVVAASKKTKKAANNKNERGSSSSPLLPAVEKRPPSVATPAMMMTSRPDAVSSSMLCLPAVSDDNNFLPTTTTTTTMQTVNNDDIVNFLFSVVVDNNDGNGMLMPPPNLLPRPVSFGDASFGEYHADDDTSTIIGHEALQHHSRKRKMMFHRQDSGGGISISYFNSLMGGGGGDNSMQTDNNNKIQRRRTPPTVTDNNANYNYAASPSPPMCVSGNSRPSSSSVEVDICDDEIMQLWKSHN